MPSLTTNSIDLKTFNETLSRYPSTIPDKLRVLDAQRYDTIPNALAQRDVPFLKKEEVELLVEWKLKHGTYRPNLLKLVQSNPASLIESTTRSAFEILSTNTNTSTSSALKILTALKGIGPATASLLLSVCEPDRVPFFEDELFWWCMWGVKEKPGGWKTTIKYTAREYECLVGWVGKLVGRLGVKAVDVERVGYVLGKEGVDIGGESDGDEDGDKRVKGEEEEEEVRKKNGAGKVKDEEQVDGEVSVGKEEEKEQGDGEVSRKKEEKIAKKGVKRKVEDSKAPIEGLRRSTRRKTKDRTSS